VQRVGLGADFFMAPRHEAGEAHPTQVAPGEASAGPQIAHLWCARPDMVHFLVVCPWAQSRRNMPYHPHGSLLMGILHAAKWHFIGMIHRINGLIRNDHDMFLSGLGKHADPAGEPIPGLVCSICFLMAIRNLNSIFDGISDSCFDWRSFCCDLSCP